MYEFTALQGGCADGGATDGCIYGGSNVGIDERTDTSADDAPRGVLHHWRLVLKLRAWRGVRGRFGMFEFASLQRGADICTFKCTDVLYCTSDVDTHENADTNADDVPRGMLLAWGHVLQMRAR